MKGIYEFCWESRRNGSVQGVFIADSKDVAGIIGKEVYFGDILGKHSNVHGTIDCGDIRLQTDDQDFIRKFEEILGEGYCSGYNPFNYYEPSDQEDEENEE